MHDFKNRFNLFFMRICQNITFIQVMKVFKIKQIVKCYFIFLIHSFKL